VDLLHRAGQATLEAGSVRGFVVQAGRGKGKAIHARTRKGGLTGGGLLKVKKKPLDLWRHKGKEKDAWPGPEWNAGGGGSTDPEDQILHWVKHEHQPILPNVGYDYL